MTQKRNTNKKELLKFAEYLHEKEYLPLIIPDTNEMWEGVDEQFQKFIISKEISCSVSLRIALYERVLLNIFVPGGITTLAYLNEHVNFLFFLKLDSLKDLLFTPKISGLLKGIFLFLIKTNLGHTKTIRLLISKMNLITLSD